MAEDCELLSVNSQHWQTPVVHRLVGAFLELLYTVRQTAQRNFVSTYIQGGYQFRPSIPGGTIPCLRIRHQLREGQS
eukprot:2121755-Rhodomonas_salina.3